MKAALVGALCLLAGCADLASIGAGAACGLATAATGGAAGLACIPVAYGAGAAASVLVDKPVTTIYVDRAEDVLEIIIRAE